MLSDEEFLASHEAESHQKFHDDETRESEILRLEKLEIENEDADMEISEKQAFM